MFVGEERERMRADSEDEREGGGGGEALKLCHEGEGRTKGLLLTDLGL